MTNAQGARGAPLRHGRQLQEVAAQHQLDTTERGLALQDPPGDGVQLVQERPCMESNKSQSVRSVAGITTSSALPPPPRPLLPPDRCATNHW